MDMGTGIESKSGAYNKRLMETSFWSLEILSSPHPVARLILLTPVFDVQKPKTKLKKMGRHEIHANPVMCLDEIEDVSASGEAN